MHIRTNRILSAHVGPLNILASSANVALALLDLGCSGLSPSKLSRANPAAMGEYPAAGDRTSGVIDPVDRILSSDPLGILGIRSEGGTEVEDAFRRGASDPDEVRAGAR